MMIALISERLTRRLSRALKMDLADTPESSNTAASELRTSIALPFDPLANTEVWNID
jgi:hypothetical protein